MTMGGMMQVPNLCVASHHIIAGLAVGSFGLGMTLIKGQCNEGRWC